MVYLTTSRYVVRTVLKLFNTQCWVECGVGLLYHAAVKVRLERNFRASYNLDNLNLLHRSGCLGAVTRNFVIDLIPEPLNPLRARQSQDA